MAKMKAAVVTKAGSDFEIQEREIPQPGAGQLRIRVHACGRRGGPRWSGMAWRPGWNLHFVSSRRFWQLCGGENHRAVGSIRREKER